MNISSILFILHFWLNILDIYVNGFQSLLIQKRVNSKNCIRIHDYIVANTVRGLYLSRDALQLTVLNRHSSCGATHIQTALFYYVHVEHCHFFMSHILSELHFQIIMHIFYTFIFTCRISHHTLYSSLYTCECARRRILYNITVILKYC